MKKNNKFGVITRPSTYIGCNNVTTFFFDPLPKIWEATSDDAMAETLSNVTKVNLDKMDLQENGCLHYKTIILLNCKSQENPHTYCVRRLFVCCH